MKEYAVLQTIGVRPLRNFGSYAIGAEGATTAFGPSIWLPAYSIVTSMAVGVIAGIPPALQIATLSIVDGLRSN